MGDGYPLFLQLAIFKCTNVSTYSMPAKLSPSRILYFQHFQWSLLHTKHFFYPIRTTAHARKSNRYSSLWATYRCAMPTQPVTHTSGVTVSEHTSKHQRVPLNTYMYIWVRRVSAFNFAATATPRTRRSPFYPNHTLHHAPWCRSFLRVPSPRTAPSSYIPTACTSPAAPLTTYRLVGWRGRRNRTV